MSTKAATANDGAARPVQAVDDALTAGVKAYALRTLGADLVGVANIERFAHAPLMMSPQGLLPTARSVVVMAVHHPDAARTGCST